MEAMKSMLLTEILPAFAVELEHLLRKEGEVDLAAQVPELVIVDRCRCGDDFCASFYTEAKPKRAYGPGHRCCELEPSEGMLILDIVAERIVHIEVLNRSEVRERLLTVLP